MSDQRNRDWLGRSLYFVVVRFDWLDGLWAGVRVNVRARSRDQAAAKAVRIAQRGTEQAWSKITVEVVPA